MAEQPNLFKLIETGDFERFLEVLDDAFKTAAHEASVRSHAMGLEVADPRAEEERRRKPVHPTDGVGFGG